MKGQVGFVLDKVALGEVSSSGPAACSSLNQFTYSLLSFASFSFQKDKRVKPGKLPKAMPFPKSWLVKYRSPFLPVLKWSCGSTLQTLNFTQILMICS